MSIIDELSNRQQFVLYKLVPIPEKPGKFDKIPCDPYTGHAIDAQSPANWLLPAEAQLWADQWGAGYGVGIVIYKGCGLFAIDFDACREPSGGWQPHVAAFLQWFPAAYVELSVSRTGAHVLGSYHGELPDHRTRNADYRAECYTEARFIALGEHISGSALADCTDALLRFLASYFPPREDVAEGVWTDQPVAAWNGPSDDAVLIERACRSTSAQAVFGHGASFAALWTANADVLGRAFPPQSPGQPWDGSAADLALANHLAFWTGSNCERMARLMHMSALVRPKWDRLDYFRGTILRACASQTQWYSEPAQSLPPQTAPPAAIDGAQQSRTPDAVTGSPTTITIEMAGLSPPVPAPPLAMANLTVNGKGLAEASLPNLVKMLAGAATAGRIGYDTFRGCVMIEQTAGQWRRITDNDMTAMRESLEREHRFAAIGKDMMRDALALVADRYQFDSAIVWLDQQAWDGTQRVDRFLHDFCGCELDEYTIAASRYIWSGLASRIYEPGGQLDMVVAMYSKIQGLYKSSALAEMVPDPEFFTDGLDLHKDTDDFKRLLRGKLVCEIAELAGLNTASVEHVKRVITRRIEEWVEKWQTLPTRYPRRCMLFATTNNEQFLPLDETGQRRWLPIEIGRINRALLKQLRGQLWAEGAAIYRMRKQLGLPGVEFENAEALAKGRHAKHEQADVWETAIASWLESPIGGPNNEILPAPGTRPFTAAEVLTGALLMNKDRMDGKAEKRVSRTLKLLGYESKAVRIGGTVSKRWVKCG